MSLIGLIRHGSTAWNKEGRAQGLADIPLDEEGINQAKALAERLSSENWDVIYSSDLLRARQTAEIIAEGKGIAKVEFDERLREVGGGKIEGTTEEERIAQWGSDWRSLDMGMETAESVIARANDCIKEILARHEGHGILIVSHGGLIGWILKSLVPHLNTDAHLGNTSFTKIKKVKDQWDCELYNCTLHLEGLSG